MLDQLIATSQKYDLDKTDFGPTTPLRYGFDSDGRLVTPADLEGNGHRAYQTTDHAFAQVCERLGPAAWPGSGRSLPKDYLEACPSELRANQLNYWREKLTMLHADRKWFMRCYQDECRAVMSGRFSVVDVTETLEWVQAALDSNPDRSYEVVRHTVTPDVLYLALGDRNVDVKDDWRGIPDGRYFSVGAMVTTGEIGNRGLSVAPYVQRNCCTNSVYTLKSEYAFYARHVGQRGILMTMFKAAIFRAFEGAYEVLQRLLDAQHEPIEKFDKRVDQLVKDKGWSTEVHDAILIGSEGYESLFGLVNGVSYAAQKLQSIDARVDMEQLAGDLLVARR